MSKIIYWTLIESSLKLDHSKVELKSLFTSFRLHLNDIIYERALKGVILSLYLKIFAYLKVVCVAMVV